MISIHAQCHDKPFNDAGYTYSILDRTAIVTHRSEEGHKKLRYTHIFIWRDNRWQAIAHHESAISE